VTKNTLQSFIALVVLLLMQGCSSRPISSALFDINDESDRDGYLWNIQQTRISTINGLSGFDNVGDIIFLHPVRGAETAIYLDLNKTKNSDFKKMVKTYKSDGSSKDLFNIRDNLLLVDKKALELLKEELNYKSKLKQFQDANKTKKKELQTYFDLNNTKAGVAAARDDFNTSYNNLLKSLRLKNSIMFKWSGSRKRDDKFNLANILNIKKDTKNSFNGFVLASSLRVERLVLNKKFVNNILESINDSWFKRTGIITYTLGAKEILYVNRKDLSKISSLIIDASLSDFDGNSKDIIKKLDNISLKLSASNLENSLSGALLENPEISFIDTNISQIRDNNANISDFNVTNFFSVYTELDGLDSLFK